MLATTNSIGHSFWEEWYNGMLLYCYVVVVVDDDDVMWCDAMRWCCYINFILFYSALIRCNGDMKEEQRGCVDFFILNELKIERVIIICRSLNTNSYSTIHLWGSPIVGELILVTTCQRWRRLSNRWTQIHVQRSIVEHEFMFNDWTKRWPYLLIVCFYEFNF